MYTGAMTLTGNATVNAKAFKSGYNPSALAAASFTNAGTTTVSPASYYVGKNGSDSNSCPSARYSTTPKSTIGAALACIGTSPGAGSGQIVEVAAGTYTESLRNNLPSGTSWSNPFTLRAKLGDRVIIKASSEANLYMAGIGTPSMYAIVDRFVFDGSNLRGGGPGGSTPGSVILSGPNYLRFTNNEFINNDYGSGMYVGNSQYLQILNNKIHGGQWNEVGFSHALYLEGSNNLIDGNELYDLAAYGIHIYSSSGLTPNNNTIRNNIIRDFGLKRPVASGILVTSNGDGNQIYNNLVYNGRGLNNDGGVGISIERTSNSKVYGNTVYNNTWYGINAMNTMNTSVTNNTIYQTEQTLITTGAVGGTFSGN